MTRKTQHTWKLTYQWPGRQPSTEIRHGHSEHQIKLGFNRWVRRLQQSGMFNELPVLIEIKMWI
jgi:hypothetical protein